MLELMHFAQEMFVNGGTRRSVARWHVPVRYRTLGRGNRNGENAGGNLVQRVGPGQIRGSLSDRGARVDRGQSAKSSQDREAARPADPRRGTRHRCHPPGENSGERGEAKEDARPEYWAAHFDAIFENQTA